MNVMMTNGSRQMIRVLVLGLLVWLGWGANPVEATEYVVTTTPAATIRYDCASSAELSAGYYVIGTAAELQTFAGIINKTMTPVEVTVVPDSGTAATSLAVENLTNDAKLDGNIVLQPTTGWANWDTTPPAGGVQWTPIGNDVNPYAGTFDGVGWTVSGIYINAPGADYQGLFGYGTNTTIIKNLGVVESYISGRNSTGGVAGYMLGTMSCCYNSGTVKGAIGSVGGVVGLVAAEVINCYNTGVVSGANFVGGVAGRGIKISNCYNTGAVSGTNFVGSIAGQAGLPTNCYYLTGSAVLSNGVVVEGFSDWADAPGVVETKPDTAFASGEVAYLLNTFIGYWTQNRGDATPSLTSDSTKAINQQITFVYTAGGANSYGYSYPNGTILTLPSPPAGSLHTYSNGGTIRSQAALASYPLAGELTFTVDQYNLAVNGEGVIEMDTAAELTEFARYVNAGNTGANGKLTADIALRNTANWADWSETQAPADIGSIPAWIPIGTDANRYNGTFDGAGWTVSGIYINAPGADGQGLFGYGNGGATIKNLGVVESYIRGRSCTGGVVGNMTGTTTGCYNSGTVTGVDSLAGGIIGYGLGTISNCYNSGEVTGINYVGGVIGDGGEMINCSNTGTVSGTTYVGSLAGYAYSIANCYYLTGTAAAGFGYLTNAPGTVAAKPDTAFTSGEVTWRLQNGQADPAVMVWGQKLDDPNKDPLPVLKATDQVYVITLMQGNGTDLYKERYRNGGSTINLPEPAAYTWRDTGGTIYPVVNDAADHTLIPSITTLPTATAVYGTKLGAIAFSGGSVPLSEWRWSGTPAELDQLPAVGNGVGYPATYTATDGIFGTQTVTINPTIKSPGGGYSPPGMSGITITPGSLSFDPNGALVVDISGLPAGATVYYSLDGVTYTTTPPVMTRAGEQQLFIRISCPGYQDYNTQTTVTVAKQEAPVLPPVPVFVPGGQPDQRFDLGALLPPGRGLTQFSLGGITDPGGILAGLPFISSDGLLSFSLLLNLAAFQPPSAASELETATTAAPTATIEVLVSMENYEDTILTLVVSESEPLGVRYLTHIQDIGWETDWVSDGALSGTAGQSKRLEALKVELTGTNLPAGASIETAVHVQNQGDLGPFAMGTAAGTSGLGLRLENICLTLTNLPGYSLRYNVHVQNQGWLRDEADPGSWFTSGEVAGTAGFGLRLEGIRIALVKDE